MSSVSASWMARRRSPSGRSGKVVTQPTSTARNPPFPLHDPVAECRGPGSIPRTIIIGDFGEDVLGDVEVGGDPLDVVEVLEQLDQAERLARLGLVELDGLLGDHRDLGSSTAMPPPSIALRTASRSAGSV